MRDKLIVSAAHFLVCRNCGGHGAIVYADGSRSKEFTDRDRALDQAEEDLHEGSILAQEYPELARQIREWRQPRLLGGNALPGLLGLAIGLALRECFEEEE